MIIAYVFTGEEERNRDGRYIIPRDVTHVSVHPSVKVIPEGLFQCHANIVEFICHDGVEKIERDAFNYCSRLRRIIMRGVKVVELCAFFGCGALTDIECPKLEIIGYTAFSSCRSLRDINLPSAKVVDGYAFIHCDVLSEAKFGNTLESIGGNAFFNCPSLERITIPLKNSLFANDDVFQECKNLRRVNLVEEVIVHDTVAALLLEEWKDDMNAEINSINHILPNARAGEYCAEDNIDDWGEKVLLIRWWITSVLYKIIKYKGEHRRLLNEAASTLQLALPNDIVTNNVLCFLELPLHTFDGENEE